MVANIKTYKDKTFTYDFLNRLISVKQNSTTLATYTYDASNRRVSKTVSNKTITYLYHNNQVVQEYENDTLTNTYLYGKYLDDPIAYDLKNVLYYYLKDSRYSIQAIINSNSTVVESYSYSPFGILTMYDVNQNVISNSNVNNTITFTGRVYDSESNLYYYRNRMYSPELARFISKDPKGYVDGMNLYAYVKNNPLRYLDPMGTTVREKFIDSDGQSGYVSYSASGRTEDYRIDYDNSNNFRGYSSTVGSYDFSSIYNTNTNDVVDYIVSATMSGASNNDLLLMIQASEIAKTFIESENVQSIVNNPSNRFAINESTANLSKVWNNLTNSLADKSDVTMTYMSEKINSTVDGIMSIDKKDMANALRFGGTTLNVAGTIMLTSPVPQIKFVGIATFGVSTTTNFIAEKLDSKPETLIRSSALDIITSNMPGGFIKDIGVEIYKTTLDNYSPQR